MTPGRRWIRDKVGAYFDGWADPLLRVVRVR